MKALVVVLGVMAVAGCQTIPASPVPAFVSQCQTIFGQAKEQGWGTATINASSYTPEFLESNWCAFRIEDKVVVGFNRPVVCPPTVLYHQWTFGEPGAELLLEKPNGTVVQVPVSHDCLYTVVTVKGDYRITSVMRKLVAAGVLIDFSRCE